MVDSIGEGSSTIPSDVAIIKSYEMLQKVLPGSTHRENPVPQACILLKIQNIHYGFT